MLYLRRKAKKVLQQSKPKLHHTEHAAKLNDAFCMGCTCLRSPLASGRPVLPAPAGRGVCGVPIQQDLVPQRFPMYSPTGAAGGAPESWLPSAPHAWLLPGLLGEVSRMICRNSGGHRNLPQGPDPARCPNNHRDRTLRHGESTNRTSYSIKRPQGKSHQRDLLHADTGTRRTPSCGFAPQGRRANTCKLRRHRGEAGHPHFPGPPPSTRPHRVRRVPRTDLPGWGSAGAAAPRGRSPPDRRLSGRLAAAAPLGAGESAQPGRSGFPFPFCFSPPSNQPRQP